MPKRAAQLSAYEVRRRSKRPGLHAVGNVPGLHLQVKGESACSWILRVKIGTQRPDIGLGAYPEVSLEQARERARAAREQIRNGIDPRAERRAARDALRAAEAKRMTFEEAAIATWNVRRQGHRNPKHSAQWISTLRTYAFPIIGDVQVADVDRGHVLKMLEPIWTKVSVTARRVRGRVEKVLDWAKSSGYRSGENPAKWDAVKDLLPDLSKVRKVKHHPSLPWQLIPTFMPRLRRNAGVAARALEFTILMAARSGEAREATWDEIDLDTKVWTVPGERMKGGLLHRVPLCDEAIQLLKTQPRIDGSPYVFTAPSGGALSDMALLMVCRRISMGVKYVPHGFRTTFKEWCRAADRMPGYKDEHSELALAHVDTNETHAAYARSELLEERRPLMEVWAQYCALPVSSAATQRQGLEQQEQQG